MIEDEDPDEDIEKQAWRIARTISLMTHGAYKAADEALLEALNTYCFRDGLSLEEVIASLMEKASTAEQAASTLREVAKKLREVDEDL